MTSALLYTITEQCCNSLFLPPVAVAMETSTYCSITCLSSPGLWLISRNVNKASRMTLRETLCFVGFKFHKIKSEIIAQMKRLQLTNSPSQPRCRWQGSVLNRYQKSATKHKADLNKWAKNQKPGRNLTVKSCSCRSSPGATQSR